MRQLGRRASLVFIASLILLSGCSQGEKEGADEQRPTTTAAFPPECEGVTPGTTSTLPARCADAIFTRALAESGSEEARKLKPSEQVAFGRGVCAYAQALAANPEHAPEYSDLLDANSKSWGVSEDVVDEIIQAAPQLCPGGMEPVLRLMTETGPITIQMQVKATGKLDVTYTLPDGESFQDQVEGPWEHQVIVESPIDFRLGARPEAGDVSCKLTVNETDVATNAGDGEAICEATSAQIRSAAL